MKLLKRILFVLLLLILVVGILVSLLLFPPIQKRIVLGQLEKRGLQAQLDYVSASFSGAQVKGLFILPPGGAAVGVGDADVRLSMFGLTGGDILINSLKVKGLSIDQTVGQDTPQTPPPAESEQVEAVPAEMKSLFETFQNAVPGKLRVRELSLSDGILYQPGQKIRFTVVQESGDASPDAPAQFALTAEAQDADGAKLWDFSGQAVLTAGAEQGIESLELTGTLTTPGQPPLEIDAQVNVPEKKVQANVSTGLTDVLPLQLSATETADNQLAGTVSLNLNESHFALFAPGTALPVERLTGKVDFDANLLTGSLNAAADLEFSGLANGQVRGQVVADGSNRFTLSVRLADFRSPEANAAIRDIAATLEGEVSNDMSFATVRGPLVVNGARGTSEMQLDFSGGNLGTASEQLHVELTSPTLYLSDLQALGKIFAEPSADAPATVQPTQATAAEKPSLADAEPFWGGRNITGSVAVDRIFYETYQLNGYESKLQSTPTRLALTDIIVRLGGSAITGMAEVTFDPAREPVYQQQLKLEGEGLQLREVLADFAPGVPGFTGTWAVAVESSGSGGNVQELADTSPFQVDLRGREGSFGNIVRDKVNETPLGLLLNNPATGTMTRIFSEALSAGGSEMAYLTSLAQQAIGLLSPLNYEQINVQLDRDATGLLEVSEILLQNELLQLKAGGAIRNSAAELMQRPLAIDAQFNARGRLGEILADMDLLTLGETNQAGFHPGFSFNVGGTLDNPESNIVDVLKGGVRTAVEKRRASQPKVLQPDQILRDLFGQ